MKIIVILITAFFGSLFAGENQRLLYNSKQTFTVKNIGENSTQFKFNFNHQKYNLIEKIKMQTQQESAKENQKKSGIKAALLSAAIPGAGEFYTESYWKSALFAVIEVAAWSGYFVYEDKGDSKDKVMKRFGDASWSEQRYWSRVYDRAIEENVWEGALLSPGDNGNLLESEIADNIEKLRGIETSGHFSYFSHTLPRTKTQQYYEMIYKYPSQFGAGWTELGELGEDIDWAYYENGKNLDRLTPDVSKYKKLRNRSNDFYATATNMASIVLINHLASAIDAAFSAKSYNAGLSYSIYAGQKRYAGERVNTYGLALSW